MDTSELDELAADFRAQQERVLTLSDQVTRKAGMDAVADAQANAPYDTGLHRDSIDMDILGVARVEVGAASNYAVPLEYGTWKMAARPHINPAVDAQVPAWQAALEQIGGDFL